MKILKANNQEASPVELPIDALHYIVKPKEEIVEKLKQSILKEGMRDPIVIACITKEDWENDSNPDILAAPVVTTSRYLYRIQRGHNRVTVAKMLGYDGIDCIVTDTIEEACKISDTIMRKNKHWIDDIERK